MAYYRIRYCPDDGHNEDRFYGGALRRYADRQTAARIAAELTERFGHCGARYVVEQAPSSFQPNAGVTSHDV